MPVGVITGSGAYSLPGLQDGEQTEVATPYGRAEVTRGKLGSEEVLHVSRHGEEHHRLSNHVPHRAHIWALKEAGARCVVATTACGAVDPDVPLGGLIVFDDLHFPVNRLDDGSICTFFDTPGERGRGHWIYDGPFSAPLRPVLVEAGREAGREVRDGGCYGHVDGPRFNTRAEIAQLAACGVTAVSQTAGPETVLAGELELPYALIGFATDYANGVKPEAPTPVEELIRLVEASTATFARTLAAAVPRVRTAPDPVGTHFSWD